MTRSNMSLAMLCAGLLSMAIVVEGKRRASPPLFLTMNDNNNQFQERQQQQHRTLSNYAYMRYDRCLRVKIPQNNDDDGNAYFYNGAYRSQSMTYLAYRLCDDYECSDGGTSYVAPSEDILDNVIEYTQGYCNACSNQCRRRRAEEEDEGGDNFQADCDTCVEECSPMLLNYYEGYDETEYLECQEAYEDEDGVAYFSGPACDSEGMLTIGLFYDEDCTVKKDSSSDGGGGYGENFGKNTFLSLEQLSIACGDGICDEMEEGFLCDDGVNKNENVEDEMYVCKAYKKVTKEWTYAKPKRDYHLAIVFSVLAVVLCFLTGSYTYFVRHKKAAAEKALIDAHHAAATAEPTKAEYAEMT